jgi:ketosteroid isomerase-like protein
MRRLSVPTLALVVGACASATVSGRATRGHERADEREIRAIIQSFPRLRDGDAEAALYAPDAWFLSPRTPEPLVGREARRLDIARRRAPAADEVTTIEPGRIVVAASRDIAYDYGTYRTTWTEAQQPQEVRGYYLRTWHKVDGQWRIAGESVQRRPLAPASPQTAPGAHAASDEPRPVKDRRGAAAFEKLKTLVGEWDAPLGNQVMTDVFRPIAYGTAILHEEWVGGKQYTATVFYLVGGELRADHFCDLKNQPRFVAKPFADSTAIEFELRDITNVDMQPRHFHSTTWRFLDANHHTQDWHVVENDHEVKVLRLQFTRKVKAP